MRRAHLADEQGVALTVAIMSLALMITLGGIALNQAIDALRHSTKQTHSKRALQAADAAIESAAYAVARIDPGGTIAIDPLAPETVLTQNCIASVGNVVGIDVQAMDPLTQEDAEGNQWCPETTAEATEGGATFSYRISQLARVNAGSCQGATGALSLQRLVVGVGRSGDQVRRVSARLQAPVAVLSGATVQSSSDTVDLRMQGSVNVVGNVTSNANIVGSPGQIIVGSAIPGPGKLVSTPGPTATSRTNACTPFTLPDINQGSAPTANSNLGGITADCVNAVTLVLALCGAGPNKVAYDHASRTLRIGANGRATLTGATYSFCSVVIEGNGVLRIPPDNPLVRIFLDDPANCPGPGGGTIRMSQSARIVNCRADTEPQSLQLYAVGNPDIATTQILSAGGSLNSVLRTSVCGVSLPAVLGEPMMVLAPHSRLELGGTVAISGQVGAEEVRMSGAASVRSVSALASLDKLGASPLLPLYEPTDYRECVGLDFAQLPAASPAQGC